MMQAIEFTSDADPGAATNIMFETVVATVIAPARREPAPNSTMGFADGDG